MATNDGLLFLATLISTATDPISLKELLGRLKTLLDELAALNQDAVNIASLENVKNELASRKLLKHANIGVQAYACCAISDILRVYAPDAPYTAGELSLIFKTFLAQIALLARPENPYFEQQSYLLKRLAEVRSIILITDLPDASLLIEATFDTFYSTAATNFPARLEPLAADILAEVIAETDQITHSVLKMILNKFLTSAPDSALTSSKSNIRNPAFAFSLHICEQNVDRLSRQVVQFFSEILAEAVPDSNKDRTAALESLRKIHNLTVQVWRFVPELLTAVIGLIDDELNADDPRLRTMATDTIGQMVAATGPTPKLNFAIAHKTTWQLWLKKTLDVSQQVRCKWLELIPAVVNASCTSEMATELSNGVTKCLLDTDERVRSTACKCLQSISFEQFATTIGSANILNTLLLLVRESHPEVRDHALRILGTYYNEYYVQLAKNHAVDYGMHSEVESSELSKIIIEDIPNHIISLIYINDKSINAAVDLCLFTNLIPLEAKTPSRVERIVQLVSVLNGKSRKAFFAITRRQQQVADVVQKLVEIANKDTKKQPSDDDKENKPEEQGKQLEKVISWICASFPEGMDTYSCLERFALLHNRRFFNLVSVCLSTESDYGAIKNSMKELLNKLQNPKNTKLDREKLVISPTDMVANMRLLLFRASPLIYNISNAREFISYAKKGLNSDAVNAILLDIASSVPQVLKTCIDSLVEVVNEDAGEKSHIMRMIYHFVKQFPDMFPDTLSTDVLERLATRGTSLEAKYAVKILGQSGAKEFSGAAITALVLPLSSDSEHFATHLSAIGTLFKSDRMAVEPNANQITSTIINEILLKNSVVSDETEWIEDVEKRPALNQKVLAISLFVNRVRSNCGHGFEELFNVAAPVFKLLYTLVNNGGDIVSSKGDYVPLPKNYLLRLRLAAGFGLLKLAKIPELEGHFDLRLSCLALLVQDSEYEVRSQFVRKLQAYVTRGCLPDKFLPFVYFSANEPNEALKSQTTLWIKSLLRREQEKNSIVVERSLVRLIHLLAHERQFVDLLEDQPMKAYEFATDYVVYYLKCVERVENSSLLYYLASRVKQYRDTTISAELYEEEPRPVSVIAMYCVSELCQLAIKEVCDFKNYTIQTWPGKIHLPSDICGPMGSSEEAHRVVSKIYIPDEIQVDLGSDIRTKYGGNKRRTEAVPLKTKRAKKAKHVESPGEKPTGRRVRSSRRERRAVTYKEVGSESETGSDSESDDEEKW